MSEVEDWSMDECIDWLKDPYNQPDRELDDVLIERFVDQLKKD